GGFFKREGRATEKETLTSRLIDRPIRPLFPDGFRNEVQVIATVMSLNPEIDGDILALIGASAALSLSGAPFQGPIGAAKVGYKDGKYLLNPTVSELQDSRLELVVAGTASAVLMVESEAQKLSEDVMLGAVIFCHQQMSLVTDAINSWQAEVGVDRAGRRPGHGRRAQGRDRRPPGPGLRDPRQAAAPRRAVDAEEGRAGAAGRRGRGQGLGPGRDVQGVRRARVPDPARF